MILSIAMGLVLNQVSPSEIASNIKELNPRVSETRAVYLSKIIYKEANRYEINPNLITAILKQESNFISSKKVCSSVRRKGVDVYTCDHGVGQINSVWVQKWALNADEVVEDDALNIHLVARVLSIIQRQFDEKNFWSRYNTSGPKRTIYEASVKGYLAEIE